MSEDGVGESREDESQQAEIASPSPSPVLINRKKLLECFVLYYICRGCSTPDYVTPDHQNLLDSLDCNKESFSCPKPPEKLNTNKGKSLRRDQVTLNPQSPVLFGKQQIEDLAQDSLETQEAKVEKTVSNGTHRIQSYVPQSAIALCRRIKSPRIRNPYLSDASETDIDPFGEQRSKCAGMSILPVDY